MVLWSRSWPELFSDVGGLLQRNHTLVGGGGNGIVSVQQGGEVGLGVSVEVMPITFRGIIRFNVECWIIKAQRLQKISFIKNFYLSLSMKEHPS